MSKHRGSLFKETGNCCQTMLQLLDYVVAVRLCCSVKLCCTHTVLLGQCEDSCLRKN